MSGLEMGRVSLWSLCRRYAIGSGLSAGLMLMTGTVSGEDLHVAILGYIGSNPSASLAEVAQFADARRQELGVGYSFDLRGDDAEIILEADDRELRVPVWPEEGACGERWVPLDALHVGRKTIDVVENGHIIRVRRPTGLNLDEHTILAPDGKTVTAVIEVPWQDGPWGVAADGRALYLRWPLLTGADEWWLNVRAQDTAITDEYPHLLLAISVDGTTSFITDPALYADQPADWLRDATDADKGAYFRRWRFRNSGHIVEFNGPCT